MHSMIIFYHVDNCEDILRTNITDWHNDEI